MNNTKINNRRIVKIFPGLSPNDRVTISAKPIIPPNINREKKIALDKFIFYLLSLNSWRH